MKFMYNKKGPLTEKWFLNGYFVLVCINWFKNKTVPHASSGLANTNCKLDLGFPQNNVHARFKNLPSNHKVAKFGLFNPFLHLHMLTFACIMGHKNTVKALLPGTFWKLGSAQMLHQVLALNVCYMYKLQNKINFKCYS